MGAGKKIEDESEARRCLLAAQRTGMSAGEWARAHGIDGRSLHAWQVNLGRRGTTARRRGRKPKSKRRARALVELVAATPSVETFGRGRYMLEIAGARLEFGEDVSTESLRRVLEVLRSC